MLRFQPLLKNENMGSILSFKDNFPAIVTNKIVSNLNNGAIEIDCPIHGQKDAVIGVMVMNSIPEFVILESCCDFQKKAIFEYLENQK